MRYLLSLLLLLLLTLPIQAQLPPTATGWQPIFIGYGSEPEMDFGGRTVTSLQSILSRAIGGIGDIGESRPAVAPTWEFPVAAALLLVQHEVGGHGGRAREFGLSPSYAFNYDFSAATGTERPPATNEENTLLAAGGAEADGVMARRVLLDLLRPEGADGAKVPLAFMAKLDLTVYVLGAEDPEDGDDFVEQYLDGNDIAYYLVSARPTASAPTPPRSGWGPTTSSRTIRSWRARGTMSGPPRSGTSSIPRWSAPWWATSASTWSEARRGCGPRSGKSRTVWV